ncbi:MAG: response regulator, partial [Muribaculaceae bacterium]|nr:response regulator [Muribaculaceae bacterium]
TEVIATIFVVDDDSDMAEYLRDILSDEFTVEKFTSPTALLDRIRTESPDIVISDVMMPEMRGDELCRIIKTDMATSHIPVILLTGLNSRRDIVAGLEARADDYVVKPFDIVVLKARIRNILTRRAELSRRMIDDNVAPEEVEELSNELDRKFMTRMREAVDAHLSDADFSVADLCNKLAMSRTSVYNKIKSLTGQSLNEFIRIMRLNRSRELLATGNYNVSEVAYMVGFSDPKYFSTCFKKQFGMSPSKL